MNSDYAWFATTTPISDTPESGRDLPHDVASVAQLWVSAVYDDLRRAGPDRATQVRWILDRYITPWFAPQTESVGDITYFMVHAWLLRLVGRQHTESNGGSLAPADPEQSWTDRELSLRQVAQKGGVSISTARRRWHDGELPGVYRNLNGTDPCVSEKTAAALATRERPTGLSQTVIADALWVLRRVLGFDPTEGLAAPTPDPAVARARRPTSKPRPLSLPECARIATHLHPVYQMVLWLQRVMGLRISEAFGLLVDDVIDHGDTGLLLVRGQGGRDFRIRDDDGRVITVPHKERTKTEASTRVLVLPMSMLELLRVAIEAFHTDPDIGDAEETSCLVPAFAPRTKNGPSGLPHGIRESRRG